MRRSPRFGAKSMESRTGFYVMMRGWIEGSIAEHGRVLLLDVHSLNHRRDGSDADPAPATDNPDIDIDLGLTTADEGNIGSVVDAFRSGLVGEAAGREVGIRRNVSVVDGGHWVPRQLFGSVW